MNHIWFLIVAASREGEKKALDDFPTMVILFFLLGVSAKHFIHEDSTTVSQNDSTWSATYNLSKTQEAKACSLITTQKSTLL